MSDRTSVTRTILVAVIGLTALAFVSACETAKPRTLGTEFLETGTKLYSQFNEELVVRHFFNDKRDGFFLDVGCFMRDKDTTTRYLETHLGWRGIAIDAQEEYAQGWRDNRPGSKFFR